MEIRTLESSRTATTPPPRVGDRMGDPPRSWSDGIPFLSKGNPLPLSHGRPVRGVPLGSNHHQRKPNLHALGREETPSSKGCRREGQVFDATVEAMPERVTVEATAYCGCVGSRARTGCVPKKGSSDGQRRKTQADARSLLVRRRMPATPTWTWNGTFKAADIAADGNGEWELDPCPCTFRWKEGA